MIIKFFLAFFFLLVSFFVNLSGVQALNCNGFGGKITDIGGTGIADARIQVYVNGTLDSLHPLGSRDDGGWTYGWPVNGVVRVDVIPTSNLYRPISQREITQCLNNILTLDSSTPPGGPTPTPLSDLYCGGGCAGPDQCNPVSPGCTQCIAGVCVDPTWAPPPPPPPPTEPCLNERKIPTAIGCVSASNINSFVAEFLKFGLSAGSGIAFLMMLFGVIRIIASQGNPESVKAGQEMISNATTGLLLIVFSLLIYYFIGTQLLAIPGLGL